VFGQSGGGPYAVACAYASPADEPVNATVVAGMGHPSQINRRDAGVYTVITLGLHARFPRVMRRVADWMYSPDWLAEDEKAGWSLRRMYRWLGEEDRKVMEAKSQAVVLATLREAYAQGSAGTIGDSVVYYGPWEFELRDVKRRVQLVFGDRDKRTPLAFGRYYMDHLPEAELVLLEDCSHFTIGKYADEIMAKVVGERPLPTKIEKG